jgi:hypothetical protein
MKTRGTQTKQKRIEDLTLREVDMIYSLRRIGNWLDSEIARRYGIVESDVRKVFEGYTELRRTAERNLSDEGLRQDPAASLAKKKPRKRRSDARYATPAERQAAYRARLQEKRHADMQFPSPAHGTDSSTPVQEEASVTAVDIP